MKIVALIPARGGSKRIPGKNKRDFRGRPIVEYAIETAIRSNLFDEVLVSTNDEEIAKIAENLGAMVPGLRSEENSGDQSTTADVVAEVLAIQSVAEQSYDLICCIYPTAVMLTDDLLKTCIELMRSHEFSSVFPVVQYPHPIWRSLELNRDGQAQYNFPEFELSRTQDCPPAYFDPGQFYVIRVKDFLETKNFLGESKGTFVIPDSSVQDIDTEEDWKMAELKHKLAFG
ncbi:MAG: pseudaminic acid cytidylyltransferase [Flavobacteriales bacterium]|jgi:pseudaminic acid cytidylyltransferase|nr:pseudaminic acid cytidylyltransferase [Flavobacteriales bacterium]MBT7749648.1 pseudaminic acid cytidylyltransferase [Flavobacteriales bacterium]